MMKWRRRASHLGRFTLWPPKLLKDERRGRLVAGLPPTSWDS